MSGSRRTRWSAAVAIAATAGCSMMSFVPQPEHKFALDFLELVWRQRTDEAFATLDPSLNNANTRSALETVERLLPGQPVHVDTVGTQMTFTRMGKGERTANLTFQLQYESAWYLANVVVRSKADHSTVIGFRCRKLTDSLQRLNAFTFGGKPVRQVLFLGVMAVAFAASLAAVVVCARSKMRRKALWILICAFGVGQLSLDWTTGAFSTNPISLQLFSTGGARASDYAPWLLSVSFPLGALLFFGLRRKLLVQPAAPPATT